MLFSTRPLSRCSVRIALGVLIVSGLVAGLLPFGKVALAEASASSQPNSNVVASYAGTYTVSTDVSGYFYETAVPDACPDSGDAQLQLMDDGTFLLTVGYWGAYHVWEIDDYKFVCTPSSVIIGFTGTYARNPNILVFTTRIINLDTGEEGEYPIGTIKGEVTFTDTSAEGKVTIAIWDDIHYVVKLDRVGPITSEYIYTTYGIRVEDSFGDNQYVQKSWSQHELDLLNDVFKELPKEMLQSMSLNRIVRNKEDVDAAGNPKSGTFGEYWPCIIEEDKDCSGSSATIRIFDRATRPSDFQDDPTGDKEFKATILHEMIHAMRYHKNQNSIYANANDSPLVQNYMDATRPNTAIEAGINHNGWAWYGKQLGWRLYGAPGNEPPTNYAKTNPMEDMSESVMMYVYDPQKLQVSSMARYNFIRDQIYGGIEYENGIQKKP